MSTIAPPRSTVDAASASSGLSPLGHAAAATRSPADDPPLSWAQTRELIRSDYGRILETMGGQTSLGKCLFWSLLPSRQAMLWYRIGRYCFLRGWRNTAWLVFLLSTYLTRIEIPPTTAIGRACLVGHAPVVLCGRFGDHFTIYGDGGTGGGIEERDIGGGPDLPVVGNNVVFAIRAMALGPIRIGDNARLGPSCTVMKDVPTGAMVAASPSRVVPMRTASPNTDNPRDNA